MPTPELHPRIVLDKVFRRYVASASTWHSRLVRFFQAQAPSPRRCEELPWHLNKCYRWHPLKNSLVDLRTFEVSKRCPSQELHYLLGAVPVSFVCHAWLLQPSTTRGSKLGCVCLFRFTSSTALLQLI